MHKFVGREREYKRDWMRAHNASLRPDPYPCARSGCATLIELQDNRRGRHPRYCSATCRNAASKARRPMPPNGPSARIYLPERPTLDDIRARITLDPQTGCWNWPRLGRDGYPRHTFGTVHRLVASIVHGELGGQPVHHACANRACVNPDHLQLVSCVANALEMLERTWYRKHIGDLRAALAEHAPEHPLLRVAWPGEG